MSIIDPFGPGASGDPMEQVLSLQTFPVGETGDEITSNQCSGSNQCGGSNICTNSNTCTNSNSCANSNVCNSPGDDTGVIAH